MKLIGIDLDGTLLNHEKQVSNENVAAIKYAQSKGAEVSIVTGRAFSDARSICDKAGINTYIISNNGASIHSKEGQQLYNVPIERDSVVEAAKWLEDKGYYYEISSDKYIYTPSNSRELLEIEIDRLKSANPETDLSEVLHYSQWVLSRQDFIRVKSYKDFSNINDSFGNILAFSLDDKKRKAGMEHFIKKKNMTLFSSAKNNFELVNIMTSKGIALEHLASLRNIYMEDTMAVGDSYNDISMLTRAGFSVAMGNAEEDIKSICKYITLTNDENGVANSIYKFLCMN